jgi:hypothetical protein
MSCGHERKGVFGVNRQLVNKPWQPAECFPAIPKNPGFETNEDQNCVFGF